MTLSTYTDESGRRVIRADLYAIREDAPGVWTAYDLTGGTWVPYPTDDSDRGTEGRRVMRVLTTLAR